MWEILLFPQEIACMENCYLENIWTISLYISASNNNELHKSFGQHSLDLCCSLCQKHFDKLAWSVF